MPCSIASFCLYGANETWLRVSISRGCDNGKSGNFSPSCDFCLSDRYHLVFAAWICSYNVGSGIKTRRRSSAVRSIRSIKCGKVKIPQVLSAIHSGIFHHVILISRQMYIEMRPWTGWIYVRTRELFYLFSFDLEWRIANYFCTYFLYIASSDPIKDYIGSHVA